MRISDWSSDVCSSDLWKHELIAAVDARIHRAPVAAPGPAEWPRVSASRDAYRRISATGRFRHDRETLVQAVTDRGAGYWLLTPLDTPDFTLLDNRCFVPPDKHEEATRAADTIYAELSIGKEWVRTWRT